MINCLKYELDVVLSNLPSTSFVVGTCVIANRPHYCSMAHFHFASFQANHPSLRVLWGRISPLVHSLRLFSPWYPAETIGQNPFFSMEPQCSQILINAIDLGKSSDDASQKLAVHLYISPAKASSGTHWEDITSRRSIFRLEVLFLDAPENMAVQH
jgi:hypothetical protein